MVRWDGEEGKGGGKIEVVGEVVIDGSSRRYQREKKKIKIKIKRGSRYGLKFGEMALFYCFDV